MTTTTPTFEELQQELTQIPARRSAAIAKADVEGLRAAKVRENEIKTEMLLIKVNNLKTELERNEGLLQSARQERDKVAPQTVKDIEKSRADSAVAEAALKEAKALWVNAINTQDRMQRTIEGYCHRRDDIQAELRAVMSQLDQL